LLDDDSDDQDEQSFSSDSQVEENTESEDKSQLAQEDELDTPQPAPQQEHQPDVAQTISQARQQDQKKGLAVSHQLVRLVYPFSYSHLTP